METGKRIVIILVTCFSCVGCDQSTKVMATRCLARNSVHSYFYDVLRIGYAENVGAFLGMGKSLPDNYRFWLFTVITGLFLGGLLIYLVTYSKQSPGAFVGSSLLLSGGASNLYDRVVNDGRVVDFINVGLGSFRTGIFNVADVAIIIGVTITLLTPHKVGGRSTNKFSP